MKTGKALLGFGALALAGSLVAYGISLQGRGTTGTCGTFTDCFSTNVSGGSGSDSGSGSGGGGSSGGSGSGGGSVVDIQVVDSNYVWTPFQQHPDFIVGTEPVKGTGIAIVPLSHYVCSVNSTSKGYYLQTSRTIGSGLEYLYYIDLTSNTSKIAVNYLNALVPGSSIIADAYGWKVFRREATSNGSNDSIVSFLYYYVYISSIGRYAHYIQHRVDELSVNYTSNTVSIVSSKSASLVSYNSTYRLFGSIYPIYVINGGDLTPDWAGCYVFYTPYMYDDGTAYRSECLASLYCPSSSDPFNMKRIYGTGLCYSSTTTQTSKRPQIPIGVYKDASGKYSFLLIDGAQGDKMLKLTFNVANSSLQSPQINGSVSTLYTPQSAIGPTGAQAIVYTTDPSEICYTDYSKVRCYEGLDLSSVSFPSPPTTKDFVIKSITNLSPTSTNVDSNGYCHYSIPNPVDHSVTSISLYIGNLYNNGSCPSIQNIRPLRPVQIKIGNHSFVVFDVQFNELSGNFSYLVRIDFRNNTLSSGLYEINLTGLGYYPGSAPVSYNAWRMNSSSIIDNMFLITDSSFSPNPAVCGWGF